MRQLTMNKIASKTPSLVPAVVPQMGFGNRKKMKQGLGMGYNLSPTHNHVWRGINDVRTLPILYMGCLITHA